MPLRRCCPTLMKTAAMRVTEIGTVGVTRAFLAANYSVPHRDDTHFVIVADSVDGTTITTCCDGLEEATGMLRLALRDIGAAQPKLAQASPSVIVGRDDLRAVLLRAGALPVDILARLRAALETGDGVREPDLADIHEGHYGDDDDD
jgi:hypothetical protein